MAKKEIIITVGQDPSPDWNELRQQLGERGGMTDLIRQIEDEKRVLDRGILDRVLLLRVSFPTADAFEFGVDEKVGVVRLRVSTRIIRSISAQKLLELGVEAWKVEQATEVKEGEPFLRVDKVKDLRERERKGAY